MRLSGCSDTDARTRAIQTLQGGIGFAPPGLHGSARHSVELSCIWRWKEILGHFRGLPGVARKRTETPGQKARASIGPSPLSDLPLGRSPGVGHAEEQVALLLASSAALA